MDPDQQLRCFDTSDLSSSDDRAAEPGGLTSGRTYSMMNIGGNARVHNGDHYTFNQYLADDGPAAKRQKSEHARQQSETLRKELLDSVRFPEMFMRQESLRASTSDTYEWVFTGKSPTAENCELRGKILAWLQTADSFFWISGKPGSGKSTLMSFMLQDPRTQWNLESWANDRNIHVLSFFFWKAGSDLQKTIPGLLRSMIWQLVKFKPNAADIMLTSNPSRSYSAWIEARLLDAVEQLLEAYQDDCILLLVDGLDECEDDLGELVETLHRFGSGDHVKTCFSSRPEAALAMRFDGLPSVSLQDLNFVDILIHARKSFRPYGTVLEALAEDVANRAEGVFLWAVLVCKSLIRGHVDRDDKITLHNRLTAFPRGLEALFARMFSEIDEVHYQSLKLYLHSVGCLEEGITLALITATLHRHRVTSIKHFVQICDDEQVRIVSQSRGLIELVDSHNLDIHDPIKGWALKSFSTGVPSRDSVDLSKSQTLQINKTLSWVHRSAYEYILGLSRTEDIFRVDANYEDRHYRSLWQGALWLAQFLPIVGLTKSCSDGPLEVYDYTSVGPFLPFATDCETIRAFVQEIEDGLITINAAIRLWMHYMQQGDSFDEVQKSRCHDWDPQLPARLLSQPMYWFWDTVFTYYPGFFAKNSHQLTRDPEAKAILPAIIARLLIIWSGDFPMRHVDEIEEQRLVAMRFIMNDIDVEAHEYNSIKNWPNVQLAESAWGVRVKLYTWQSGAFSIPDEKSVVMDFVSASNDLWQKKYVRASYATMVPRGDMIDGFTTMQASLARVFDLLDVWHIFVSILTYPLTQDLRFRALDIQLPIRYSFSLLAGLRHQDVNILDLVTAKPTIRICCMRWQRWHESNEWPTQEDTALQVFDLSTTLSERLMRLLSQQERSLSYHPHPGHSIKLTPRQDVGDDVGGTGIVSVFAGSLMEFHALTEMALDEIWKDNMDQLTAWGRLYCRACVRRWFKLFWVLEDKA